jgi:hypothetical protein
VTDGQLVLESLQIVKKVLSSLRAWTKGDGLNQEQVETINSYYTALKDCDYQGMHTSLEFYVRRSRHVTFVYCSVFKAIILLSV